MRLTEQKRKEKKTKSSPEILLYTYSQNIFHYNNVMIIFLKNIKSLNYALAIHSLFTIIQLSLLNFIGEE